MRQFGAVSSSIAVKNTPLAQPRSITDTVPNPDHICVSDLTEARTRFVALCKALKMVQLTKFVFRSSTLECELCQVVPEKVYQVRIKAIGRFFIDEKV